MPSPREALTGSQQRAVARTLLPRAGARSETDALPEPYMLTIQGGRRSIAMPREGPKPTKDESTGNRRWNHGAAGSRGKLNAAMEARANCRMRAWQFGPRTGKTAAAR